MTRATVTLSLSSFLVLATVALATGCNRGAPKGEAKATAATLPGARPVEAPKPEMPKAGPPGWAYINAGGDIVAIDPTGQVQTLKAPGGYSFAQHIIRASDGKAYALLSRSQNGEEVVWLDENRLVSVAKMSGCSLANGAFDARDDHMVASCGNKLQEKTAGGTWTSIAPPDSLGATRSSVTIAKGGALWYVAHDGSRTRAVYERKAGTWTALDIKQSEYDTPKAFVEGEGGVIWTSYGRLVRATEGATAPIYAEKNLSALTPASNGLLGFWSRDKRTLELRTVAGSIKRFESKGWLYHASLDDTGRTWAVVDNQLQVADARGATVEIAMGSYPELERLDISSEVTVLGAGPAVPEAKPVRRVKKVSGRIAIDRKPLANAEIEVCPRNGFTFAGVTPCTGAADSIVFRATTDANGAFSIEEVPVGRLYVYFKGPLDKKWSVDSTPIPNMREGGTVTLGTLAFAGKK